MLKTDQATDAEPKSRVRGPALETLADVRRQAKRLYAEHVLTADGTPLPTDRLRVAVALLALIKSTILEEQERAPIEPGLKGQVRRLNRQMTRLMGPPPGSAEDEADEMEETDEADEADEDENLDDEEDGEYEEDTEEREEHGEDESAGGALGEQDALEDPGTGEPAERGEDVPRVAARPGGVGGPEPAAAPPRVA
jgi:hypothetical protein